MAWYSRENRRRNKIALAVASVVFLGVVLYGPAVWTDLQYAQLGEQRKDDRKAAMARAAAEAKAKREVKVTDRYDLAWPARTNAAEFRMSIPSAELGAWRNARNAEVKETIQGPDKVEMVLLLPREQRLVTMELYRDSPPANDCALGFEVRSRSGRVRLDPRKPCAEFPQETQAYATEEARVAVERLVFETLTPPSVDMRLQRAREALEPCKAVPYPQNGLLCGYAVALSHSLLRQAPAQASEILLAAMATQSDRNLGWDDFYTEDALAALSSAGQGEGSLAVAAHALRARRKRESLDAVFALAPKLDADDPTQQLIHDAMPQYLDVDDATRIKMHEVAVQWHEKAAAKDPGSDLALKTRFYACVGALYAPVPDYRKQLGRCADDYLGLWQKRADTGLASIGLSDASMGSTLPMFWYSYAFASKDFRGGVEGLRRVKAFAAKRLPPATNPWIYEEIGKYEKMLADKSG